MSNFLKKIFEDDISGLILRAWKKRPEKRRVKIKIRDRERKIKEK